MAFTPATCRDALHDLLVGIAPTIGMVHKRRRILRTEQDVARHCIDPTLQYVQAWMISPAQAAVATTTRHPGNAGIGTRSTGNDITAFQFQIEAYRAVQDDDDSRSEEVFMDLVWAVCLELNHYAVIPNTGGAHMQSAANVDAFGFVALAGSVLCHMARIDILFTGRTR